MFLWCFGRFRDRSGRPVVVVFSIRRFRAGPDDGPASSLRFCVRCRFLFRIGFPCSGIGTTALRVRSSPPPWLAVAFVRPGFPRRIKDKPEPVTNRNGRKSFPESAPAARRKSRDDIRPVVRRFSGDGGPLGSLPDLFGGDASGRRAGDMRSGRAVSREPGVSGRNSRGVPCRVGVTDRLDMGFVVALDMPLSAGVAFLVCISCRNGRKRPFPGRFLDGFARRFPAFGGVPRPADWVGATAATGCSERVGGHSGARRCGSGSYGLRS